ncbi:hypothetical protein [Aliikangiella coralliicola]|uniref:DUF1496 domain-containing protein n=1 Tax=Aliikangiella coralliicola TaxID=2592383 RepID=A0A545UFK5_9GAMM|nr:hypothetical protein [Aliikangiella coralliicola]TQV88256.1 hypothetical protein FLL46_06940 [Aliikangiella coralliicola]
MKKVIQSFSVVMALLISTNVFASQFVCVGKDLWMCQNQCVIKITPSGVKIKDSRGGWVQKLPKSPGRPICDFK